MFAEEKQVLTFSPSHLSIIETNFPLKKLK